jgi:DNA-binding Lrp family transcriptional regulator
MRINIRKRYLFFILAFSSAIIASINAGVDTVAGSLMDNYWVLSISCFILALIISLLCSFLFSIPLNKKSIGSIVLDPSFKRIRMIKKQEVFYHILAGFGNAIMTIGYFALFYDTSLGSSPAVILPFSQIVILYLVIAESISEKDTPTLFDIQSAIIVTFGAILGSISLVGTISASALAIVFFIINPGSMLFSYYQRKLKLLTIDNSPNDAINIRLWNVIFALSITLVITSLYDIYFQVNNLIYGLLASIQFFGWMALMALGSFFSFVLYIRSLGIGKASTAQAVKSSVVIFSIPVTIVLSAFGLSDPFPTDPVLLLIKIIGISMIVLGISAFALTLTRAYIFIRMKPGYDIYDTLNKLWNIKGVNRVTAVAGSYDFIIKIHTRTLLKGYERILRKVKSIQGIQESTWHSVLKDWEDI